MTGPVTPTSAGMRPAEAVRRVLRRIARRRTPTPPGPDFAFPAAPEVRPLVPEPHEAREWLFARIDDLAERGALDEAHGDLFDPLVDDVVDVWDGGHTQYHRDQREHLARLAMAEQDLQVTASWVHRQADEAEATVAELDGEIGRLLDEIDEEARVRRSDRLQRRAERAQWRAEIRQQRREARRLRLAERQRRRTARWARRARAGR